MKEKDERKQDGSDAATGVNYSVASFLSWSKSICNSETGISKIRATSKDYCLLKGEHLEWLWTSRQAPWLKNIRFTPIPLCDGVDHRWW